jgi:DNA-directed RNA polymerase beta' subunit
VFDGDEMNLHMPQDEESEIELRNLAAVPYQIISPANNSAIVGIFQDSLLGSYRITRENIKFDVREAMNLLMAFNKIDVSLFKKKQKKEITNFEVLSQILPPMTIKYKTKHFGENDKYEDSNNVFEVVNGRYIRGQLEKGVLGSNGKGMLQRICNYYGNQASADFVDNLQNIVTEYMKTSAYSVGISDLIADEETNNKIAETITGKKKDVKGLIDQTHLGIFENKTGKTNEEEFETQVTNILNKATAESGKIGRQSLSKDNRFVIMVNAGSKGSELNISQMISCLGQQTVDGKRIPYGFESRTLPHYTKYDDSPTARGFVESSFISGLTPEELFFHAMGGRVGLIDTAVKTSQTGYIQRRLIKGMEDLKVEYDMTVRNNKQKIVQFVYGDDAIDTVRVENQVLPLINMSLEEIYAHYHMPKDDTTDQVFITSYTKGAVNRMKKQEEQLKIRCKEYIEYMIEQRDNIVANIFMNTSNNMIHLPVAFQHIINNIQGMQNINKNSLVDITPLEVFDLIETTFKNLSMLHYAPPTELFKVLYNFYLSPKDLLMVKRFNRKTVISLLEMVTTVYKNAIVAPGEMVGMIAAQSIGEPTTQMSTIRTESIRIIKKNKHTHEITSMRTEIGTLCDDLINQLPEYTFNTSHHDSVETLLDTLEEDYYIVGVDETEKTQWNKISHISRHPVNGEMMKVTTKSGRIVETTTSHSHLIRENQSVVPITGANMIVGMRIPVAKHIDNKFEQYSIEIGETQYKLDYLFGWFIGAYLAEGNIINNQIQISSIHEAFIQNTQTIADLFGRTTYINNRPGEYGPSTTTSFSHKELSQLLLKTCNTGSFVKTVPEFAFTAPNEFKAGLIQAYFDGDGNFQHDDKHHQIRVCSRSKQLIKDMALMLNYFDIFGSIKENNVKGSTMYNLAISAKYAELYQNQIGSLKHDDKLSQLVKYIHRENVHSLSDDIDRISGLGDIIAMCGKTLKLAGQSRKYGRWAKKETIGRRTLHKYINIFTFHPDSRLIQSELNILKQAAESNVVWDEIVDIQLYTPDQTEYVYDFTVPANQTFMLDSGVIVHNTLNTFHFAGVASKSNVTRGVPRIEEILSLSDNPKNPSVTIYLKEHEETSRECAQELITVLEHTKLSELVSSIDICFDPDDLNTLIEEDLDVISQYYEFENMLNDCNGQETVNAKDQSKWIIRMELDKESMLDKNISMDDVNYAINNSYNKEVSCVYSDYNSDTLVFRIRLNSIISNKKKTATVNPLDQSDEIYLLKNFQDQLLHNIILRGIKKIGKVILRKITDNVVPEEGKFVKRESWVLDTVGTNLIDILALDYIDVTRTISNDIQEIYNLFGIEAARQAIFNELTEVIEFDSTYINYHHLSLLCDRMCYSSKMISIFRHGINNDDIGPIAKASFEETPEMFLKAARHAELDSMRGVSANVMCGQQGYFGTSAFQVMADMNEVMKYNVVKEDDDEVPENIIDSAFGNVQSVDNACSAEALNIENNAANIKKVDLGDSDDDYDMEF